MHNRYGHKETNCDERNCEAQIIPIKDGIDVCVAVRIHTASYPVDNAEGYVSQNDDKRLIKMHQATRSAAHDSVDDRRDAVETVDQKVNRF